MIDRQVYGKNFSSVQRTLSRRLETYLEKPDSDNVRRLQSSTRRLIAATELLPKKVRTRKKLEKFVDSYRQLKKLNNKVRELDVILSKVPLQSGGHDRLVKELLADRKRHVERGIREASKIKEKSVLSIPVSEIPEKKLKARYEKATGRLVKRIEKRLPIVLENPEDKLEMHTLREDSRELRHLLELAGSSEKTKSLMVLRSWQDALGAVRDSDVFIEHFQDDGDEPAIREMVEAETNVRKQNFEAFRSATRDRTMFFQSLEKTTTRS